MSLRRAALPVLALAALAGPVLAGCGGDGGGAESPDELLDQARTTLDETQTVHFVLTSDGAPGTGTLLLGGEGDVARPASFAGVLHVQAAGSSLDLPVVSVDGTVYAQIPFTEGYSVVDPADYGFGDPGALLDPDTGISSLLSAAEDAELGDERRVAGEVVREVTVSIPGERVEEVLTSADPSRPVAARMSIASDSGQLLRAELTGPFFSADDSTFILELSDYGADVEITAPATG
jgi:hypothetical protein